MTRSDLRLTLAEASSVMRPYLTEEQFRQLIKTLGIKPTGTRRLGNRGRPHDTYDYATLLRLHAALVPFISNNLS